MIKTRSQLTLPDFNYDLLGRSPLKDARTALRTAYGSPDTMQRSGSQGDGYNTGMEEVDPKHPKRSSETVWDPEVLRERTTKRVKRVPPPDQDEDEDEGEAVRSDYPLTDHKPLASISVDNWSRKPVSTASLPPYSDETKATPSRSMSRSQSVPVERSVPVIDFHRLPRSPSKSPSKSKQTFRFTSVPPADATQCTTSDAGPTPRQEARITVTAAMADDDIVMSPISTEPLAIFRSSSPIAAPGSQATWLSSEASIPTSPLTPLPQTPLPPKPKASSSQYRDMVVEVDEMEMDIRQAPSRPRTPSGSRIPRPAMPGAKTGFSMASPFPAVSQITPKRGVVSRMKPRGTKATSEAASSSSKTPTTTENTPKASRMTKAPASGAAPSREYVMNEGSTTATPTVTSKPTLERALAELPSKQEDTTQKSVLLVGSIDMEVPLNDTKDETEAGGSRYAMFTTSDSKQAAPSNLSSAKPGVPASTVSKLKRPAPGPAVRSEIPLGGRMTRSASLRQKENKKNMEVVSHAEHGSRQGTNSNAGSRPTTPAPSATPSTSTVTPGKLTPGRKRAMSVPSVARPTLSSAAKANPPTPGRSRPPSSMSNVSRPGTASSTDSSSRPASAMSAARPSSSMKKSQGPNNLSRPPNSAAARMPMSSETASAAPPKSMSSLSNLSLALEKLNVPAPTRASSSMGLSRPNTSLGFNRDKREGMDDSEDEDDTNLKKLRRSSAPKTASGSKDDSTLATSAGTANRDHTNAVSKSVQLKRAASMGPSTFKGAKPGEKQSTLMLPPPVPKARLSNEASDTESSNAATVRAKINLHSGMVAGKPRGGRAFGGTSRMKFGVAPLPGMMGPATGGRSRVVHRVSKQSSLPVVEGSPVKPGGGDIVMAEESEQSEAERSDRMSGIDDEANAAKSQDKGKGKALDTFSAGFTHTLDIDTIRAIVRQEVDEEDGDDEQGPQSPDKWKRNASRRASAASHLLSQSMSSLPRTPPRKLPATEGKGKGRALSSSFPQSSLQQTAPSALGRAPRVGARVSANTRGMSAAVAKAEAVTASPDTSIEGTVISEATPPGSASDRPLRILKECNIFVDVRTDDGDDAGGLFADMLKKLGAKLLSRVGQRCTHIVYKNGLMSTLTRYRQLNDPKPLVVGIAWVVECAEQARRADETKFLVNLEGVNVAGANKRRRSMLPKHLTDFGSDPRSVISPVGQSGESSGDRPQDVQSSPPEDDTSANNSLESNLPPLERARRRQHNLMSMFGRPQAPQ